MSGNALGSGAKFIGIDVRGCIGEGDVAHAIGRDDVDVAVRNLETGDDQADAFAAERFLLGFSDSVGDVEEASASGGVEVRPLVHLGRRDDECMTVGDRVDGHEDHGVVLAVHEMTG